MDVGEGAAHLAGQRRPDGREDATHRRRVRGWRPEDEPRRRAPRRSTARSGHARQDVGIEDDALDVRFLRQVQDDYGYGAGYGSGYGRYGSQYGMYNSVPVIRTYEVEVMVVRLNLYDGKTGQPVWSSSAETSSKGSLSERSDALRESLNKAVQAYPPH